MNLQFDSLFIIPPKLVTEKLIWYLVLNNYAKPLPAIFQPWKL